MRGVIISDTHCGSLAGLCPPEYQNELNRWMAEPLWDWYMKTLEEISAVDICIVNGDIIDGEQKKSGGLDLISTDVWVQQKMAIKVLSEIKANEWRFTYGTPYHGVNGSRDEEVVADHFKGEIKENLRLDLKGVKLDVRHTISATQNPYGQASSAFKEVVRDLVTSTDCDAEPADVVIRSHAHSYWNVKNDRKEAIITPCMQVPETVFGFKCKTWYYTLGLIEFEVHNGKFLHTLRTPPFRFSGKKEYEKWK